MNEQTINFEQYLAALPVERRGEVERVWQTVRRSVPSSYKERIGAKFLTFAADEEMLVALANQKNYISLYLVPLYIFPELKAKFDASASKKRVKCGKSCINFTRADDLPLEVIGEIIASCPDAKNYKSQIQNTRANGGKCG